MLAPTSGARFLGGLTKLGVTDPFSLATTSVARFLGGLAKLEALESLEVLVRLEALERLDSLVRLDSLEPLENPASLAVNIEGVNFIIIQGFKVEKINHFSSIASLYGIRKTRIANVQEEQHCAE